MIFLFINIKVYYPNPLKENTVYMQCFFKGCVPVASAVSFFWYLEAIFPSPPVTPLLSQSINSISPLSECFHITKDVCEV